MRSTTLPLGTVVLSHGFPGFDDASGQMLIESVELCLGFIFNGEFEPEPPSYTKSR